MNLTVEVYELERPTEGPRIIHLPIGGTLLGLFSSCAPKASNLAWLAYTNPGVGMEMRTLTVLQAGSVLPHGAKVLGILSAKEGGMDLLVLLRPTLQGRQIASMVHDELGGTPAQLKDEAPWLQELREKHVGKGPITPPPPSPQPVSGIASGATYSPEERADTAKRFDRGTCGSPVRTPPSPSSTTLHHPSTSCGANSSAPVDLRLLPQTPGFPGLSIPNVELDRIDQMRAAISEGCSCPSCSDRLLSFQRLAIGAYPLLVEELRYWRARNPTV